jgi:hypothetical protein
MISLKQIQTKFIKKDRSFKGGSFWSNINIYWKVAVGVMFVAVLVCIVFGYNFFIKINEEFVVSEPGISGQSDAVRKEKIKKVLDYFSIRKQQSNQIISSPAPVIDPSL